MILLIGAVMCMILLTGALIQVFKESAPSKFGEPRFVQLRNPKSGRYIKIDRKNGVIIGTKKTPYKNVTIIPCRNSGPGIEVDINDE